MAGGADDGSRYSITTAFIFVFNLIVGLGALALPLAFKSAGLVLGSIFLAFLCFLSYITVTFMVESQSIANAILLSDKGSEESQAIVKTINLQYQSDVSELDMDEKKSSFYIRQRVEISQMAKMFIGDWGQRWFLLIMIIYLYGDLAIYAVSVPTSITKVTGGWAHFNEDQVTNIYLGIFAVLLVPFTFFDFQKTKFLQIATLAIRNVSLFGMIILATIYDSEGEGSIPTSWFNWRGLPDIFGTAIYAFMCHHSLPSIITPIENQKNLKRMLLVDSLFVLITYLLLCWTALWAFGNVVNPTCTNDPGPPCALQSIYTLNFASYKIRPIATFLVLYPSFTLSSNFPLIAITLRNNLMQLITYKEHSMHPLLRRIIFGLISSVPPLIIAFATKDLKELVNITGAYAGLGIMFLFPTVLVYYAREKISDLLGPNNETNFLRSPFKHVGWIWLMLVWCVLALAGTIYRQIVTALTPASHTNITLEYELDF